ncbi:MAG: hypothetical protein AAGF23_08215 [Acidobacteriota bacterium]
MSKMTKTSPHLEDCDAPDVRDHFDPKSAAELLPWLITDSLDADEAEAVLSHVEANLHGDELLRAEVAATGEMLWLTGQHPSSLTLAELALGLPLSELPDTDEVRRELHAHIESCPDCRAEMAMILEEHVEESAPAPVVDFADVRRRRRSDQPVRRRPQRHRFAIAAALAATVTGALLVQSLRQGSGETISPGATVAEVSSVDHLESDKNGDVLRTSSTADAFFSDGFESGDTSQWAFVTN